MNSAQVIPFRAQELLLVDNAGEPFVPMKPVVEGMGLAWQTQHRKLMTGRFAPTVTEMVIVAQDSKQREMTCLPLRKLTGWLMSIHPNKVRPELREGIIGYQNECDDVLWSYWNNGMAVRTHDRNAVTVVAELVGVTELTVLKGVIYDKAKLVTKDKRISFIHTMHNRLHTRFNVPRVELIPAQQFEAACNFVAAYALEGEWIEAEKPREEPRLNIHFPVEALVKRRPGMAEDRGDGHLWLDVSCDDINIRPMDMTLCEQLLGELQRAGYDISGAWWEIRTFRNTLRRLTDRIEGTAQMLRDPIRYAAEWNGTV
ncbi:phage antirepressor N-terminal domain-containing protein [Pseudomonas paralcaligenes]|uniref:phage antirepressor N-terminal domain-containing protein n=1 Tax=Pseudomonas paralcaligenes TaxID=2772558 RepID=UPI001C807063|nr:phage antirepressor N-terminal domain-containing protein [Pseudomonas paralcaligenes]